MFSTFKMWFEDGTLHNETEYEKGVKHGKSIVYWPNGKVRAIEYYYFDRLDEEYLRYFETGELCCQYFFDRGMKVGVWKRFSREGEQVLEIDYTPDGKVVNFIHPNEHPEEFRSDLVLAEFSDSSEESSYDDDNDDSVEEWSESEDDDFA